MIIERGNIEAGKRYVYLPILIQRSGDKVGQLFTNRTDLMAALRKHGGCFQVFAMDATYYRDVMGSDPWGWDVPTFKVSADRLMTVSFH